jgi:hypothetical protein
MNGTEPDNATAPRSVDQQQACSDLLGRLRGWLHGLEAMQPNCRKMADPEFNTHDADGWKNVLEIELDQIKTLKDAIAAIESQNARSQAQSAQTPNQH